MEKEERRGGWNIPGRADGIGVEIGRDCLWFVLVIDEQIDK